MISIARADHLGGLSLLLLLGVLAGMLFVPSTGSAQSEVLSPISQEGSSVEGSETPDADDPPPRPRRRGRRGPVPASAPTPAPEKEEAEEEAPEEDRWFALVGGTIHTVSDGVIEEGTILVKNGRIEEIGVGLTVPDEAEVLAVPELHVYPGLVAIDSVGIIGDPNDVDPYSFNMLLALAGGVTTARVGGTIGKLTYGTLEGRELGRARFTTLRYSSRDPAGRRKLREAFERILEFRRESARHAEAKKEDPDLKDLDRKWIKGLYATAEKLMNRELVGYASVSEAVDIRAICALAEKYQFDLVLEGAQEGWLEATAIARSGARVIVTPRDRRDRDDRRVAPSGGSIENAAILQRHGVPIAIFPVGSLFAPGGGVSLSGLAGRDLMNLPLEAAFAVRGGLSNEAAIRAITLDAARLLGVADRVGSIEVGKDADFVVTDGDLLHYLSLPQYTIVNGRIAYDQEKAGILDHVRPDGDPEPQAPREPWPRRLGDPF